MTAEEFVKGFWVERKSIIENTFNPDSGQLVSQLIAKMQLDDTKQTQLREIISELLTDTFYTILLGLDGEASIGKVQTPYKIFDEQGNELTTSGEIEQYAYAYFQENTVTE